MLLKLIPVHTFKTTPMSQVSSEDVPSQMIILNFHVLPGTIILHLVKDVSQDMIWSTENVLNPLALMVNTRDMDNVSKTQLDVLSTVTLLNVHNVQMDIT